LKIVRWCEEPVPEYRVATEHGVADLGSSPTVKEGV